MTQGEYYQNKLKETLELFGPEYAVVEIGTDGGPTARLAMQALKGKKHWFHTIDPYGDKPYRIGPSVQNGMGYTDTHYRTVIAELYNYANEFVINYTHWKVLSLDWIKFFPQLSFWADGEIKKPHFCFAFLDGDHAWEPVREEFNFFYAHMPKGGVIVIDDFNFLGGEHDVRTSLTNPGKWHFNYDDNHYRAYFTKC